MPTYEYECGACGHAFELFQSIKADPVRKCPACGRLRVQRLISAGAGVIFKGSGFYETDYRSESYKKAAKAERDAAAGTKSDDKAKAGTAKSDGAAGKPAAPDEPKAKPSKSPAS